MSRRARVVLVVNPVASAVTAKRVRAVTAALQEKHKLEVIETRARDHARELATDAAKRGNDIVAVFGGDGTLNEAANGLVDTDCALAVLPGGSTNVFARSLGVPRDPARAAVRVTMGISERTIRRIDVGRVGDRAFLFCVGVGFDAAVVAEVERHHECKRVASEAVYIAAAVRTWLRTRHSLPVFESIAGDRTATCRFALVSCSTPYTYLGSRPMVVMRAGASPLGLATFESCGLPALLLSTALSLLPGALVRHQPGVRCLDALEELRLKGAEPFPFQVDGDYAGTARQLQFGWTPRCLEIVVGC